MEIKIAKICGLCAGCKRAINTAKELLTSVKFTANHDKLHSSLEYLINAALEELESK